MRADLELLESRIGYRFAGRDLLDRALTHRSFYDEAGSVTPYAREAERLEFLGDSVLGCVVSDMLWRRFPEWSEGQLTRLKAGLVSANYLYDAARRLSLGDYLRLGPIEDERGGRTRKNLLSDALESLVAAVYLDGGFEAARRLVDVHIVAGAIENEALIRQALTNYKELLVNYTQVRRLPPPRYITVQETGPPNERVFTVEVRVDGGHTGEGRGTTKKAASQEAARDICQRLAIS